MRNPQRFEGLEEDEITWFSNSVSQSRHNSDGLEGCEITWCSSPTAVKNHECAGLEEDKIAGFSN